MQITNDLLNVVNVSNESYQQQQKNKRKTTTNHTNCCSCGTLHHDGSDLESCLSLMQSIYQ